MIREFPINTRKLARLRTAGLLARREREVVAAEVNAAWKDVIAAKASALDLVDRPKRQVGQLDAPEWRDARYEVIGYLNVPIHAAAALPCPREPAHTDGSSLRRYADAAQRFVSLSKERDSVNTRTQSVVDLLYRLNEYAARHGHPEY